MGVATRAILSYRFPSMKFSIGTAAVLLALSFLGCGVDDTATSADNEDPRFATITGLGGDEEPEIEPSDLPPPKKVLKRDLEVGAGTTAHRGDEVTVRFLGVNYQTGEAQYDRWDPEDPLVIQLGFAGGGEAWEENIEGMKPGGIRELVIPSHLQYEDGTIDYVVKLVRVASEKKRSNAG